MASFLFNQNQQSNNNIKLITMKRTFIAFSAFAVALLLASCGGSKKTTGVTSGEKEIILHCSGAEYSSDKKHFRATSTGKSQSLEIAKEKAYTNTRTRLASLINVTVKTVTDNYAKSVTMNNQEVAEDRFETLTRQTVNQELNNTKIICEKLTQDQQGNYTYYVAMEMAADDLLNSMNNTLSKEKELKVDYDYEKFKQTYEAEMSKMGQ